MKHAVIAAALAMASFAVHADSITDYIQFEAGIGASHVADMGDGTWIQQGAPNNKEKQNTPAFMAGFTGPIVQRGAFDLRWHLNYVYIGTYTASVDGVPDTNYNPHTHQVHDFVNTRYSPFNGQGHTQGVPFTLDAGYTYRGFRFGVEGGVWAYAQSWHESLYDLGNNWDHFTRKAKIQFGYVVGANVSRGPFSVSYRYYQIRPDWSGNGTPGLATGAHVLMGTYRF
jgi:hypothetical protein